MEFIPEKPVHDCLARIAGAIQRGAEFCVGNGTGIGQRGYFQCATSGSSGAPKRIRRTHDSWIASFTANAQLFGISQNDCYAVLGSLAHSLSLYAVIEGVHLGADVRVLAGVRPDRQDLNGVTVLYATPTQLRLLADTPRQFSEMRLVLVGGADLDPATRSAAKAMFPNAAIHAFYGASETSFVSITGDLTPEGSVGKPYPKVEIKIENPDAQGVGEIWVRSPYLFSGYAMGGSEETRLKDGFVTVGELGRMDAKGNLFIVGRKSRMFTVADQNVYPEAIEAYARSGGFDMPLAVIAAADPRLGSVPILFYQGHENPALRDWMTGLSMHQRPRQCIALAQLPLLAAGKIDYRALLKLAAGL